MQYQFVNDQHRLVHAIYDDGTYVPFFIGENSHYNPELFATYEAWLAQGNVTLPPKDAS